jgi:PPOX class probable F420-dependent enzyme
MAGGTLARFRGEKYLNLETFRKSGAGVRTPLWFVERAGVLYVRTPDDAGKIKRIRHTSRARVAPSTATGQPKGEWLEAEARFASPDEAAAANALLNRKYRWMKRLIDLGTRLRGRGHVVIAIRLV